MARTNILPAHEPAQARVLIVDDSAVARAVLSRIIRDDDRFTVVGTVADAESALGVLSQTRVDVILLDLEMPGTHGLIALPALLAAGGEARVLIVSSSCEDGARTTLKALALGAADTLVKPGAGGFGGRFAETLTEKLCRLAEQSLDYPAIPFSRPATAPDFDVVAIGASTGGIRALGQVLQALPADFAKPILITQHLPASFSPYFAAQVAAQAKRPCDIAVDRLRLRPGRVVVAPGNAHMTCVSLGERGAALRLSAAPAQSGCLPSVDPMFSSLAAVFGSRVLGVVLSGMGRDGVEGATAIHAAGGNVVAQDRESSVVWGMPGAVVAAGIVGLVAEPAAIGRYIASARGAL